MRNFKVLGRTLEADRLYVMDRGYAKFALFNGIVNADSTNLLDVPAEIIALIYRFRWTIEVFFRFFQQILGCRKLYFRSQNGIELQAYCAIIACMLLWLWTGRKPTKRTRIVR